MRVLHTSDWHIGQNFFGESRIEEQKQFLKWLIELLKKEKIDILIVAGDIFDTTTPSNSATALYFNFLKEVSALKLKTIIIGGNHDSYSFLNASRDILKLLDIDIVASNKIEDIVISLDEAIICAVPFLKESFVREYSPNLANRAKEYIDGVKNFYEICYQKALELKRDKDIAIIATGHFSTTSAVKSESEREIFIGGEIDIDSSFLAKFDYVALGHLHNNQKVGFEHIRYSGSPIALSFSEKRQKRLNLIEFEGSKIKEIKLIDIPIFKELITIKGDLKKVEQELKNINKNSYIEIILEEVNIALANEKIKEISLKENLNIVVVKSSQSIKLLQNSKKEIINLEEMNEVELFLKRLELEEFDKKIEQKLLETYKEILFEVQSEDIKD